MTRLVTAAIVDSGFTSSLTLPATVVTALGLARQSGGTAVLADGSIRQFDIFAAEVLWGGTWRAVLVQRSATSACWECVFWRDTNW
jgi:predicted aspartyl protease